MSMTINEWHDASQTLNKSDSIVKQNAAKDIMRRGFEHIPDGEFAIMCIDALSILRERDPIAYASVLSAALIHEGII